MPRPRQAQGRPGTAVMPAVWSAGHRPVVEAAFTASCEMRRPGDASTILDPTTGKTTRVPRPVHYAGPCSVEVLSAGEQEALTGDQQVTTVGYRVSIAYDVAPELRVDDLVKVTAVDDNGDPTLVGRVLKVLSFARGSVAWERDINCVDDLG